MLTLHPTKRLGIATEDDLSLRWGAQESAAAARPGWREHLAGPAMGEENLSQERRCSEGLSLVCSSKLTRCGGGSETGCAAGRHWLSCGFCLGTEPGDKDTQRTNLIYAFLT